MRRRFISFITAVSLLMSLVSSMSVSADYSAAGDTYTWDFAEYTTSKTGEALGTNAEDYQGLTIRLADNNANDKISTGGVYWNGKSASDTANTRYILYTPGKAGTLYATGNPNGNNNRWGISIGTNNASNLKDDGSSIKGSGQVSLKCSANASYYIVSKDNKATISKVWYVLDEGTVDDIVLPAEPMLNDSDSDSVTFNFKNTEIADTTQVTADDIYKSSVQYGYTSSDDLTVGADGTTSTSDFTFNIRLENGNYDITLDTTATTVSYEQIPNITYATRIKTFDGEKKFTAAVCDETFDITIPANETITSLSITKQAEKEQRAKPALFAVGDSTVNTTETNSSHLDRGASKTWGVCVTEEDVTLPSNISAFYNCGQAGANTITYYNDYEHENIGHLDDVLLNICPGDYVTVNLGINNQRGKEKTGTADDISDTSAYKTIVRDYILQGIIDRGGIPVVLTATPHGPIDDYTSRYSDGVFSCERTGSDARTSTLVSIANGLSVPVINVGAWGNDYFNSITEAEATAAGYSSVLEYVQSMYIDHNHYKEALGTKIASYVLSSVASIIEGKKEYTMAGTAASVTATVNGAEKIEIDTSSMPANDTVKEYEVTLSKNGKKLRSSRVPAAATVYTETVGADKVDVSAVYRYENVSDVSAGSVKLSDFESGLYNITFQKNGKARCDIYVNDAMVGNNIDQSGAGRSPSAGSLYTANNVNVTDSISVQTKDFSGNSKITKFDYVEAVKAPASVDRRTKVFVIGDSLAANYYGGNESSYLGTTQTGWGQALSNFVNTDKYEVVNLANSGEYARSLYETAFPGVIANSESGDILIFEAGYNDKTKSTEAEMTEYMGKVVDEAKAANIIPILVNPNATPEEYNSVVKLGDVMKSVAEAKNVKFVDLSKLSYAYLYSLYGDDSSTKSLLKATLALNTSDDTHTSYLGAMKYASIVAGELYSEYKNNETYKDLVNTAYTYEKSDGKGNTVTCNALQIIDASNIPEKDPEPSDPESGDVSVTAPTGLLTNELEYPLNAEEPTFGWIVNGEGENIVQTAYQIVVTDEITGTTVWDSGKVISSEQSYIPCDGTLAAGHPYSWKVRTWINNNETQSDYSDKAYFATGLNAEEWEKATWISDGTAGATAKEGTYNHFWYARKSDTLDSSKTVAKAMAYISGLQDYDLYVNNTEIGRGQSFDYASESRYQGWDITDAVKSVSDTITVGALVRTYGGGQGRAAVNAGLLGYINVFYTDGTVKTIKTDNTWKVSKSVPFSGTTKRNGEGDFVENYNAQNAQDGFTLASFDDSAWTAASDRTVDEEITKPIAELSKPTSYEVEPVEIKVIDGVTVADFGVVIPARPEITFKNGIAGKSVTIQGGYMLNADGKINTSSNATQSTVMTWTYIEKDGEQTYHAWDHLGFRYLQIPECGETFTKKTLKARVVHTNVPAGRGSTFTSSNKMLDDVYELMKRSSIYGVQNEFVDTPTREKGQFTDDSRNISEATMATQFEREASRKAINQFLASADRYWKNEDGTYQGRYNSVYPNVDGKRDIPEYSVNMPQWVWNYYMNTGDKATLEKAYPYMLATADYISENINGTTGLVEKLMGGDGSPNSYQYGIVDWPEPGRFGYDWSGTKQGARTTVNMLSKHAFDVVALAAAELGNEADKTDMENRSQALKTAINNGLINDEGLYVDGTNGSAKVSHVSQHANSFALAFDVVPDANKDKVAEYVAGLGMRQGPMTADILAKGLFNGGENTAALKLFTEPNDYGWAKEITNGGTFTWESWMADGSSRDDSQSHAWGSTAASDILRNFAGVQNLEAGAKLIKIAPVYTDLTSLNAKVSTERGFVGVQYERDDTKYDITITVPANVQAQIELPVIGDGEFKRNGGTAPTSTKTDTVQTFNVGSGTYSFSYDGNITEQPEKVVYRIPADNGIKGTNNAETNTYTYEIGNSFDNKSSYSDESDYLNLTVGLGSGDSLTEDSGIVFAGTAVPDSGSVNTTGRYLLVEPKRSGTLTMNVTGKGTKNNRVYYYDFGTGTVDLSKCTKADGTNAKELTSNRATDVTIAMTAGNKYVVYPYANNNGTTISSISYEYTDVEIPKISDGLDKKYMHISFDDVYACLKDITDNQATYSSVFDNSFFADLKSLHDTYGAVFTLNCFIKTTKNGGYDILNLPDKYAEELAANDTWLKFAFHAQDDNATYGPTTATSSGKLATVEETKASYKKFTDAIMKATGNNVSSIDTVTRLGFFSGNDDNVDALTKCDYGITGLLTADDTRVSYYFDTALNNHIIQNGYHYDSDKKLKLIKTITRLENSSFSTAALDTCAGNMIEVFTHESEYLTKETVRTNLENAIKWANSNNCGFGYAMYLIDPKTPQTDKPVETKAPVETEKPTANTIEILKEETKENTVDYTLKVNGISDGTLIAAVYNDDKSLYSVDTENFNGGNVKLSVDIPDGAETADVKFMLWDGLETMVPLAMLKHTYKAAGVIPVIPYEPVEEEASAITLDRKAYPLVVGNTSKTDFSDWETRGSSITINAVVDSDTYSTSNLTWSVEDDSIAYINSSSTSGVSSVSVKGKRTGFTKVTAKLPDGDTAECYISVIDNVTRSTVQTLEFNTDAITLAEGGTATLIPIINPKDIFGNGTLDASLTWQTSNASVATVTDGVVTAVGNGTATITATSQDVGRTATCTVTVGDNAVSAQSETKSDIVNMTVGDTKTLGDGDTKLTWKSDNSFIADVDENGVVTAYSNSNTEKLVNNENYVSGNTSEPLKASEKRIDFEDGKVVYEKGTVKIYATAPNGAVTTYNVSVADAPVKVQSIALSENTTALGVGDAKTLKAAILPANAMDKRVTWSSSDPSVATVSSNSLTIEELNSTTVTGVAAGTATITAECDGAVAECEVTVTASTVKVSDITITNAKEIDIDEVLELETQITENAYDTELLWISSDADIVSVNDDGMIQGLKSGSVKVYAIAADQLTAEQRTTLEELQYTRSGEANTLTAFLTGKVYGSCNITVKESSPYLRNLHIPAETITDTSVNLLWNSASKMDIEDLDSYNVYVNGTLAVSTKTLGYTVNDLLPATNYTFKVDAVTSGGDVLETSTVTAKTKAKSVWLNVVDYGAIGDGKHMDTLAIQKAIDICPENGTVYLPKGYVFYSGALFLKSDMTLRVDGILLGSTYSKDYPFMVTRWEGWRKVNQKASAWANTTSSLPDNHYAHSSLINAGTYDEGLTGHTGAYNVENIVICGNGQINGNGFKLGYNEGVNQKTGGNNQTKGTGIPVPMTPALDQTIRGRTITIHNAENVYMKDIQIAYAPSWTIHPIYNKNLTVDNIEVVSRGDGQTGAADDICILNGDGIDPESSIKVNIFNTFFRTGDDAVAVKTGRNREGNELKKPGQFIRITDSESNSSKGGFAVGSENGSGVRNVLMQNLKVRSILLSDGICFKTYWSRGGLSENIQVKDIDSDKKIEFAMNYSSSPNNPAVKVPEYRYITVENVNTSVYFIGLGAVTSGSEQHGSTYVNNVTVRGASSGSITYGKDFTIWDSYSSKWTQSNTDNIEFKYTNGDTSTDIKAKDSAQYVSSVDIQNHTITAVIGATEAQILSDIEPLIPTAQLTYSFNNGVLTVTAQDGVTTADYVVSYAKVWDFAKYTTEIKATENGFTESYDGLTIAIANNGAESSHDKITTEGVYWRGGASSGNSTRYIAYTPDTNGTLIVTGKVNANSGRLGISDSLVVTSLKADSTSTTSTSSATFSKECTAGTTYYIMPKDKSATVSKIAYIPN